MTDGYDTAPRYLDAHVAALEADGYAVETFDLDAPPVNGGTPNPVPHAQIKYPTYLGVMSHFDAVIYYTGDDLLRRTCHSPIRAARRRTRPRPATTTASWAHKVMLDLREYANNGGKLLIDGRNVHQPFTSTSSSLSATGPYTWTPDKLFGFYYPPNNEGDDDRPAPPGSGRGRSPTTRGRTTSASSAVRAATASRARSSTLRRWHRRPVRCSRAWRPSRQRRGRATTRRRTPKATRCRWPSRRCGCATGQHRQGTSRCARRRIQADYATEPAQSNNGGAIMSTRDTVTLGFGLEQVEPGHAQRAGPAPR